MRKTMLLAGVVLFLACWLSSCAQHRHRIESGNSHAQYWNRHGSGWYK